MTAPEVAAQIRMVLDEIGAGQLECSPAYRWMLTGAAIALEAAEVSASSSSAR